MSSNLDALSRAAPVKTPPSALHTPCTMGDLVLRAIARGGEQVAFISNGRPTSYAEFGRRLSCFAQALSAVGIGSGSSVAALAGTSLEAYLVTCACYLLGARLTNLHPMGSADDHAYISEHCDAGWLVFEPHVHGSRAADLGARAQGRLRLMALGDCEGVPDLVDHAARLEPAGLACVADADDICWIVYTGGTTGKPKGVVHTHRSLVAVMMAELAEWEWPERPVFLAITPISHGAGPCIPPVLLRGGTVVLEDGFSPSKFLELVQKHEVNATFLVPTMIYKVLDHLEGKAPKLTLQLVIYGAAPMAPTRLREALRAFGQVFMQLYGQSEAPNCVTVLRRRDHNPDDFPERLGSCGLPIASNRVALLDPEGQPVADGDTGELCVRGPLVMTCYWKDPEETAKATRHGWLHTGDLARKGQDGYLYIVGRSKDMIISGGFNVYPIEVEDVLCSHPAVSSAAVIGTPDRTWGEAVTALVTLRPGHAVSAAELIARVRSAKGPICTPKTVDFVDAIPLTALGKPDKKLLRERYAQSHGYR